MLSVQLIQADIDSGLAGLDFGLVQFPGTVPNTDLQALALATGKDKETASWDGEQKWDNLYLGFLPVWEALGYFQEPVKSKGEDRPLMLPGASKLRCGA